MKKLSQENTIEQRKRTEIVWGIMVAGVASFAIGILVNAYYDLFVNVTTTWSKINHTQIYGTGLILVAIIGLLKFFIDDYKNDLEVNKSFFKRYRDYFFYSFTPGKVIRIILGLYILIILIGFIFLIYYFVAKSTGYIFASVLFLLSFVGAYLKDKREKILNNKKS